MEQKYPTESNIEEHKDELMASIQHHIILNDNPDIIINHMMVLYNDFVLDLQNRGKEIKGEKTFIEALKRTTLGKPNKKYVYLMEFEYKNHSCYQHITEDFAMKHKDNPHIKCVKLQETN